MTEVEIANVVRIVKESVLVPVQYREVIVGRLRSNLAPESGGRDRCECGEMVLDAITGTYSKVYADLSSCDHTREKCVRQPRFRLEGRGVIDTVGGLSLCTGCGKLPPHAGCKAICAACSPPNGTCYCEGCTIAGKGAPSPSSPSSAQGDDALSRLSRAGRGRGK